MLIACSESKMKKRMERIRVIIACSESKIKDEKKMEGLGRTESASVSVARGGKKNRKRRQRRLLESNLSRTKYTYVDKLDC